MAKEEKLRLDIEARGADKAAGDVEKVDAAQKGLTDQTKDAVKPTEELDEATQKLQATEETYTALLSRIHPALGAMADAMVKGSKVAGDLGSQQIDLTAITQKATAAFNENAKTIALLGSAGVAAVGFTALAKSIAYVREESEKLQARLDALEERATTAQQEVIAGEQRVIEAARARREGPPAAEEAAGMRAMYREFRRVDRIPPELLDELEKNIATLYGTASKQMIETITLGAREPIDPRLSRETRERRARQAAEEAEESAARTREEYRARRRRERELAAEELLDPDITRGRTHIHAELGRLGVELEDEEQKKVIEATRRYFQLRKEREAYPRRQLEEGGRYRPLGEATDEELRAHAVEEQLGSWKRAFVGRRSEEFIALEAALKQLIGVLERQANDRQPTIQFHNTRMICPTTSKFVKHTNENYRYRISDG